MDKDYKRKYANTYLRTQNTNTPESFNNNNTDSESISGMEQEPLTTKKAIELLLAGTLKYKVCRYCLNVSSFLSELDQVLQVAGKETLHKITIRDMVTSFHPFKVADAPNFPNRICNRCLNRTMQAYFFAQQCERAERSLRNCIDDVYEKFEKLDPLERPKKRGRQKQNPNPNKIHVEYDKVIEYAEPIINLVNTGTILLENDTEEGKIDKLTCPRCWLVLPNIESLLNHEKMHPKTMWYHCQACGKSFPKKTVLNRHIRRAHIPELDQSVNSIKYFKCMDCGNISQTYNQHLQHIEKHKFKMVLEHLVNRNMDKLCSVCLNKGEKLVNMDKTICLHGGYPEISGEKTLYNILGTTIPEMNYLPNYTGNNICEKCLNHSILSYVFIHQTHCVRNRLSVCVSLILESLNKINEGNGNAFVEISQNIILPIKDQSNLDEVLAFNENDDINESELSIDVLEDEFRIISDTESESEAKPNDKLYNSIKGGNPVFNDAELNDILDEISNIDDTLTKGNIKLNILDDLDDDDSVILENPAKKVTRTYSKRKLVNGYQQKFSSDDNGARLKSEDDCSEVLTFKKTKPIKTFYRCKYMCPMCSKYFVSDYHLKRHVVKHAIKIVECKICNSKFKSRFHLHEHIKMVHLLKKTKFATCTTCGRIFSDVNKLELHENSHVEKQCMLCDKFFASQKHYDSHMQRHAVKLNVVHERKAQACSFCEKEYSDENILSLHVNKVHLQIKPFSCDMCDKQFYTEENMNSHKKVHSLHSKEECIFCKKLFKSRRDIVIHIRKHIGVKPNQCQVCGQSFYSESKLKNHMLKYHGGRYPCKLCKTVFASKTSLRDHVNVAHSVF